MTPASDVNADMTAAALKARLEAAIACHQSGDLNRAEAGYRDILAATPNHGDALHLLGLVHLHREDHRSAAALIEQAVAQHPDMPFYYNNLGLARMGLGEADRARACYEHALALHPRYPEAWFNLGRVYHRGGETDRALACMKKVLELDGGSVMAHARMGEIFQASGKAAQAVNSFEQALALDPDHFEARHNLGLALHDLGRLDAALDCLQTLAVRRPANAPVQNSLGAVYFELGCRAAARDCFQKALSINPEFAAAHNNLGNLLQDAGQMAAAAERYGRAIAIDSDFAEAHNNLGMAFQETGQAGAAIVHYRKAIDIRPDYAEACAHLVHQLQRTCDWQDLPAAETRLDALTHRALSGGGRVAEQPFVSLVRGVAPDRQLALAQAWAERAVRLAPGANGPFSHPTAIQGDRPITVGYLSGNFRNHPMAHLMASLFETHDRSRLRVHCYSFGEDDGSDYRRRIAAGCDRFVDIDPLSHVEAAGQIHTDGVDILVDLMGHTKGNRMSICALRPAPVQTRYLGLAGTTGADFFDYLICDATVVPEALAEHYSERPLYMPHCYQVNDHHQPVADRTWTRACANLPESGPVFCCFNHAYKIDPVMFKAWMTILARVPEGVLWLLSTTRLAEENLRGQAESHGISPNRLIFAEKLPKPDHLARLRLADLALDTRLVSGAATTSDALWAGVPVVTLAGDQFASRMSASILTAVGLSELVAHNIDGFIARVVGLASEPEQRERLREKLERNRSCAPLFDTRRFARNLEDGLQQIWDRYVAGKAPRPVHIVEK
jgi:protein O-GlcNAc transferase